MTDQAELRRLKARRYSRPAGALLLAPVCCVLNIVLFYQLALYGPGPFSGSSDLRLPWSSARGEVTPAVQLTVTRTAVLVDQRKVADVADGRLVDPHIGTEALGDALARRTEVLHFSSHYHSDDDMNLMLIADMDTPFSLLRSLLQVAESKGFTRYGFVVYADQP